MNNYYKDKLDEVEKKLKKQLRYKKSLNKRLYNNVKHYNFIYKLSNRFFQSMLVFSVCTITYLSYKNILTSALFSILVLLITNIIRVIFLYIYKPDGLKLHELQELVDSINDLARKREVLFSIYDYSINGKLSIMNNIKRKINDKKYLNYDSYLDEEWIKNDSVLYHKLIEMKVCEDELTETIKNKIYLELNYPEYSEELTLEQLNLIQNAL